MKDLRIIVTTVLLMYLGAISLTASASEREGDDDRQKTSVTSYKDDDRYERMSPRAKEILKKLYELKKKREEEKKKRKSRSNSGVVLPPKPVNNSGSTNTGSTSTGNTNTGTTNTGTTTTTPVTKIATVNYNTPDGMVPVVFSVTVNNGTITAASSTTQVGGTSGYYQNVFAQGISSAVVGKKVTGLSLSAVGGASLTTNAFKQFVAANF